MPVTDSNLDHDTPEDLDRGIVYYLPEHPLANDLEALEARVLQERPECPYTLFFRPLREADLRLWSPFRLVGEETDYLARGYAYDPAAGRNPKNNLPLPPWNEAHNLGEQQGFGALHALAFLTATAITAVQRQDETPEWLTGDVTEILAPVCGKATRPHELRPRAGDEEVAAVREFPLVRDRGLLWGCRDFDVPRIILPSVVGTPAAAIRSGRNAIIDLYAADVATIKAAIAHELGAEACAECGFEASATVLWLCQATMMMRISVEEVRRRAYAWAKSRDFRERDRARENRELRNRIGRPYGIPPKAERWRRILISEERPNLIRRSLTAFFGVSYDPWQRYDYDDPEFDVEIEIQNLIFWIGQLRRAGHAELDPRLAKTINRHCGAPAKEYEHRFGERQGNEFGALLANLLHADAWDALDDAASLILNGARKTVPVTYSWRDYARRGAIGVLHPNAHLELVGPLLMRPLHGAETWNRLAAELTERGLYLR